MKKILNLCLILSLLLLLTGCGNKFEPTESTIFVTSKGVVQSAVMESFDQGYYKFDELTEEVEKAVKAYCLDVNEEAVSIDALTQSEDMVTLQMQYQTVDDYADFNDVLLFSGTLSEAIGAGYVPETLLDTDGQIVELDDEKDSDLKVIVTEESICIQTSGKIKYVSDNVTILEKKLARALEAGKTHPAFVLYK